MAITRAWVLGASLVTLCSAVGCVPGDDDPDGTPPALVLLIVVDQFRADLLERYEPFLTGGLRRMLDDGHQFTQARHDHGITNSSPGHATLATGRFPAHNGIVDNSWLELVDGEWRPVSAVDDSATQVVGFPELRSASPRNRLAEGLADWTARADEYARIVAIGQGAHSTNSLAGKTGGHAYWSSPEAGQFVTSTYYRDEYPEWVDRFNSELLPQLLADRVWQSTTPAAARDAARPDATPYEADGTHTTFPHVFREEAAPEDIGDPEAFYGWFISKPTHDEAILTLAREAVRSLALGRRSSTDYLGINLSSLDDVGHDYGPFSQEQLDAVLRIDRALGEFFEFLDDQVGPRRYLVALSGDHGVATAPEYAEELGVPGRRVSRDEIDRVIAAAHALGQPPGEYSDALANRVAEVAERFDFVADAMTRRELEEGEPADSFVALYRRSYRPDRALWFPLYSRDRQFLAGFGVFVRLTEGTMPDYATSVHGSPYEYDRRVPLLFMGVGIPQGVSHQPVRTVDAAPTLAWLAGVPIPDDVDGRPLFARSSMD